MLPMCIGLYKYMYIYKDLTITQKHMNSDLNQISTVLAINA